MSDLTTSKPQAFPNITAPLVDPQTGVISPVWYRYFVTLFARTGGAQGKDIIPVVDNLDSAFAEMALQNESEPNFPAGAADQATWMAQALTLEAPESPASGPKAVQVVALGASPFTFTAPFDGRLIVSGGGVSALAFSRDGVNFFSTGSFYGAFSLTRGDQIRVTYPGSAPSVEFVPL